MSTAVNAMIKLGELVQRGLNETTEVVNRCSKMTRTRTPPML